MGLLDKLLRRQPSHDEWLASHPGKDSKNSPPPEVSAEEEKGTRDRMEAEMDAARSKRDQS